MSDDDVLADLRMARDRIDRAIEALESGSGEDDAPDVAPCPECGASFETLTAKLNHARDEHGVDV